MYIPKHNLIEDYEKIAGFLKENSFGILANYDGAKISATHIPIQLIESENGQWLLRGHIAKANPQWNSLEQDAQTLVIFTEAHTFVSSSWYQSKSVPTWNYIAVHVYGKAQLMDEEALYQLLKHQVELYESGEKNPVQFKDYGEDYIRKLMKGIVGIEIQVEEVQAKYKLSQNKTEHDFNNVIHELEKRSDANSNKIAREMKNLKKS